MQIGDRVTVREDFDVAELRGRSGRVEEIPLSVVTALENRERADLKAGKSVWVVFKPEGTTLEITEVDAGVFSTNDLTPT